jgi:hypothetical protein
MLMDGFAIGEGKTMRASLGLIGLLIVLGIGYYIYSSQIGQVADDKPAIQQINLTAIRSDLLSLGQAERLFFAANGSYATLEQLRSSGVMSSIPEGNRSGYRYTAEVDGASHFRITANPPGSSSGDLPTFSIDETMQISE